MRRNRAEDSALNTLTPDQLRVLDGLETRALFAYVSSRRSMIPRPRARQCGHKETVEGCRACYQHINTQRLRALQVAEAHSLTEEQLIARYKLFKKRFKIQTECSELAAFIVRTSELSRADAEALVRYFEYYGGAA